MKTQQIFKKAALAGALLVAASNSAQAGALASSVVELNDLVFSQGGTTLDISNFANNFVAYTSDGDADVKLTGYADATATGTSSSAAIGIDLYSCLGDCAIYTDNDFAANVISSADSQPTTNYSIADQLEVGSPITGLGVPAGTTLGNASQASVVGDANASSLSNNTLGVTWVFSGFSGAIDITFDLDAYIETYVSSDANFPTNAKASWTIGWAITEVMTGNTVWVDTMSETKSSIAPFSNGLSNLGFGNAIDTPFSTAVSLTTAVLDENVVYNLSGTITTSADVTSVPEPSALALMGLGLLGLAGAVRRRKSA